MKQYRVLAALAAGALLIFSSAACMHLPSARKRNTSSPGSKDFSSPPRAAEAPRGPVSASWYEGAAGYNLAAREWREARTPAVIYFYTDWCGYCKEFERELLGSVEVVKYLRGVVKVRINPEAGSQEDELAKMYRITGYPSFFVYPSGGARPVKVARHKKVGGERVLMTPAEFVNACQTAGR